MTTKTERKKFKIINFKKKRNKLKKHLLSLELNKMNLKLKLIDFLQIMMM